MMQDQQSPHISFQYSTRKCFECIDELRVELSNEGRAIVIVVDDVLIVWILGDAEVEEGGLLEFVFVGAKDEGGKEGCVIHE